MSRPPTHKMLYRDHRDKAIDRDRDGDSDRDTDRPQYRVRSNRLVWNGCQQTGLGTEHCIYIYLYVELFMV